MNRCVAGVDEKLSAVGIRGDCSLFPFLEAIDVSCPGMSACKPCASGIVLRGSVGLGASDVIAIIPTAITPVAATRSAVLSNSLATTALYQTTEVNQEQSALMIVGEGIDV